MTIECKIYAQIWPLKKPTHTEAQGWEDQHWDTKSFATNLILDEHIYWIPGFKGEASKHKKFCRNLTFKDTHTQTSKVKGLGK